MSEYGTDIADPPAEPIDTGADVSGAEATDYSDEPTDLAEAPAEPDVPEVEEEPHAQDLSEPTSDEFGDAVEATVDIREPADLGEALETSGAVPEDPRDWQQGEVVDVGHDATPEPPRETETAEMEDPAGTDLGQPEATESSEIDVPPDVAGEDLAAPDSVEADPESLADTADTAPEPTIDELTEAARDEARPADELRAEHDADVADVLANDAPSGAELAGVQEVPNAEAADGPEVSGKPDTAPDLGNSPENGALTSALAERGLSLEPVDRFDYSDNPVLGYRESAPPEDVAYAVNAWNDQIAPGIATGATREDFAAYDQAHGLEGQQQLAGVYDYMLKDPIHGDIRADGTIDPGGGRHRLEQASLNGVRFVPFKTDGSKA